MGLVGRSRYSSLMSEPEIRGFHAHIYYDPEQVDRARALAAAAQDRFAIAVGHFHLRPVGPHPRGSCQLTVPRELFGDVAQWLTLNRGGLTIFAHADTGNDLPDHTDHVIWFGPSEALDLSIFG
jgi:aromatic ring-cleaving dioxygenase